MKNNTRTVKLSDLESIVENGVKIKNKRWGGLEYIRYIEAVWKDEVDQFALSPAVENIQKGEYVFYEEPKQVVPDYFYKAYFQHENTLGSDIVFNKEEFNRVYSDVKWVRFEKVFLKDLEE